MLAYNQLLAENEHVHTFGMEKHKERDRYYDCPWMHVKLSFGTGIINTGKRQHHSKVLIPLGNLAKCTENP